MRASPRVRRTLLALVVVLGIAVIATGWLAFRGVQAARALESVGDVVVDMKADLAEGRTEDLLDRLPQIQEDAADARRAASDPVWRLAEHLPVVGDDLTAVRTVAIAMDDVARDALPVVADLGTVLTGEGVRAVDGRIDLAPLVDAAPALDQADATTRAASDAVAALDTSTLVDRVAGPVAEVQDALDRASAALAIADQVAVLVPPMLGADEPRTYLLLSLNSAELRSAGGIVGAVAVLRIENGSISLVDQRTTPDLPATDESVLPLTPDELVVHTDALGRFIQDVVFTPDFPRSAELAQAIWTASTGQVVDGVIATDPVAASYLLDATGPVTAPDGTELRSDNLLAILLHDAYLAIPDPDAVDDFYTGVAGAVFGAVSDGRGDSRALVEQLARAGEEMRLRVWSAHPEEQAQLGGMLLGAGFLSGGDDDAAGVFLNDGSASKLDYFLSTTVTVESATCVAGGESVIQLDLAYEPPADVAEYPMYVTGYRGAGLPTGWVQTNVTVYSPVGGTITEQRVDDGFVGGLEASEGGRDVSVLTSRLSPGQRVTYRFTVQGGSGAPDVWTTPTLTGPGLVRSTCPAVDVATD